MRRAVVAVAALSAVGGLLAGCGSDVAVGVASRAPREPGPGATTPSRPTGRPWPHYRAENYSYELVRGCFCVDRGVPVRITVHDGKVADVVYARAGFGHAVGDHVADPSLHLTIDDILDEANDPRAASVRVRWLAGQDHPASVWIDWHEDYADDEVWFDIRHVTSPAGHTTTLRRSRWSHRRRSGSADGDRRQNASWLRPPGRAMRRPG
jgi:hypothetical protein